MRRTFRSRRPPLGPGRTSLAACTEPAETDTAQTFYAQLAVSLPQSHGLHGDTVSGHEHIMGVWSDPRYLVSAGWRTRDGKRVPMIAVEFDDARGALFLSPAKARRLAASLQRALASPTPLSPQ